MAIITIWSKLLPVGAADAVAGNERSIIPIERAARIAGRPFLSKSRNIPKRFSIQFVRSSLPTLSAREHTGIGARKQNPSQRAQRSALRSHYGSGIKRILIVSFAF